MNEPQSYSRAKGSWFQTGLLATLTVTIWLAVSVWPQILAAIGILDYGTNYLDSYAILAALDAVRLGADPHAANPLDALMRGHVYSDWWLALRWLGLTRANNFMVGTVWVGAFGLTAWVTTRPRNWGETLWLVLVMISPAFMLAIKRANNDLVIFVLLTVCGSVAVAPVWWRQIIAVASLGLATGLKYFPAPAVFAFLWVRPVRRMPTVLMFGLIAVALVMDSVSTQINRGRFKIGSDVYTMGAALWWRDHGWKDSASAIPGLLAIIAMAALFAIGRVTTGLATHGTPAEKLRAALGLIVLLTCFVTGVNYAYRWIFVVWPAIWIWRRARDPLASLRERWIGCLSCWLIGFCLWLDGALCLAGNLFLRDISPPAMEHLEFIWRLWTQPLCWILMFLFAGWLLEGSLVTGKEWWASRHEP